MTNLDMSLLIRALHLPHPYQGLQIACSIRQNCTSVVCFVSKALQLSFHTVPLQAVRMLSIEQTARWDFIQATAAEQQVRMREIVSRGAGTETEKK